MGKRLVRIIGTSAAAGLGCGFALGLMAMFARVAPFVDSGSSNRSLSRYTAWVPAFSIAGLVLGILVGVILAIAAAIASRLRRTY